MLSSMLAPLVMGAARLTELRDIVRRWLLPESPPPPPPHAVRLVSRSVETRPIDLRETDILDTRVTT